MIFDMNELNENNYNNGRTVTSLHITLWEGKNHAPRIDYEQFPT